MNIIATHIFRKFAEIFNVQDLEYEDSGMNSYNQ